MGTQLQHILVVLLLVQLCLMNFKALAKLHSKIYTNQTAMTKPGCPFTCSGASDIRIPYPFGIGRDCALDETFIINCNTSFDPPRPFISGIDLQIHDSIVHVDMATKETHTSAMDVKVRITVHGPSVRIGPFGMLRDGMF
ncbi:hypothetical protein LguiA_026319 [Lonicera macranthoides]